MSSYDFNTQKIRKIDGISFKHENRRGDTDKI